MPITRGLEHGGEGRDPRNSSWRGRPIERNGNIDIQILCELAIKTDAPCIDCRICNRRRRIDGEH